MAIAGLVPSGAGPAPEWQLRMQAKEISDARINLRNPVRIVNELTDSATQYEQTNVGHIRPQGLTRTERGFLVDFDLAVP